MTTAYADDNAPRERTPVSDACQASLLCGFGRAEPRDRAAIQEQFDSLSDLPNSAFDAHWWPVVTAARGLRAEGRGVDMASLKDAVLSGNPNERQRDEWIEFEANAHEQSALPVLMAEVWATSIRRAYVERVAIGVGARIAKAGPNPEDIQAAAANEAARLAALAAPSDDAHPTVRAFPEPEPAVFHGVLGELVAAITPHTEAHPMAILAQLLCVVGVLIGRTGHVCAEATKHFPALFAVLVGDSSKARKGTSLSLVMWVLENVIEPDWVRDHVKTGSSSGEGLIHALRDKTQAKEAAEGETRAATPEPLQDDKRLVIIETEFAGPLRSMGRDGNTLSPVWRRAWDGDTLSVLTKNVPETATEAHVGILGHITRDELLRLFKDTDATNGLGNRFLWIAVRRNRLLPEGGALSDTLIAPHRFRLRRAIDRARTRGKMHRDPAAKALWRDVYPALSASAPGLLGSMTDRAEAQVMRLSLLYALLDESDVIRRAHLEAALAFWRYCEASARWIFGESMGDPLADTLLAKLRDAGQVGLTRTQISGALGHNVSAERIARALGQLSDRRLALSRRVSTRGRAAERWYAPSALSTCPNCGGQEADGIPHADGPHCHKCDVALEIVS